MANNLPVPETKIEYYLNAIAGGATPSPDPGPEPTPSSSGVMRIEMNMSTMALDKTWQEISDCFANGGYAYISGVLGPAQTGLMSIVAIGSAGSEYAVFVYAFIQGGMQMEFTCSSPDEYPVYDDGR